jgi:peroxiredoxin
MLSAEQNLGGFLRSLLTPARPTTPVPPLQFSLGYTSAEIRQTGIILHGNVSVPVWPPPRVEYEPITATSGTGPGHAPPDAAVDEGPDYSALKTWIPGGSIDRYEWHRQGQSGYTDPNRFVLLHQGPTSTMAMGGAAQPVSGYAPLCLTVHGTRLSPAGAVTNQQVVWTVCGYRSWPIGGDLAISDAVLAPMMALTRSGPGGRVEVVGHAAAMRSSPMQSAPNVIVHFADERSSQSIAEIPQALRESGRTDAGTAVLIVAKASQLPSLPFSDDLTYAEDDGAWRRRLGVASGSATVVVSPDGKIVWRSDKPLDMRELPSVLGKVLAKASPSKATMLTLNARVGQRAPNFLFEHAPGQQLTLRKLGGRSAVVVFFRNALEPSVDAVREAIAAAGRKGSNDPVVFAVSNDGASRKNDLTPAIVVDDRDGKIAAAYGVTMWPTTVTIDDSGIVRNIAYGHLTRGETPRA